MKVEKEKGAGMPRELEELFAQVDAIQVTIDELKKKLDEPGNTGGNTGEFYMKIPMVAYQRIRVGDWVYRRSLQGVELVEKTGRVTGFNKANTDFFVSDVVYHIRSKKSSVCDIGKGVCEELWAMDIPSISFQICVDEEEAKLLFLSPKAAKEEINALTLLGEWLR